MRIRRVFEFIHLNIQDIEIVLDNAPAAEDKPKEAAKPLIGLPIPKLDSTGVSAPVKSGIDIEAMGQYEGVDIINVDLDGFEDKPWRKPGADITDYFNFGFNEQSWRAYCTKQKLFRDELQSRAVNNSFAYVFRLESNLMLILIMICKLMIKLENKTLDQVNIKEMPHQIEGNVTVMVP
ncbi:Fip1 motif-domain-containing protein [Globomyces pollinis-pini]|nr:Fip1 motif-domain-containing protein [Globomyces pollinis-pini]